MYVSELSFRDPYCSQNRTKVTKIVSKEPVSEGKSFDSLPPLSGTPIHVLCVCERIRDGGSQPNVRYCEEGKKGKPAWWLSLAAMTNCHGGNNDKTEATGEGGGGGYKGLGYTHSYMSLINKHMSRATLKTDRWFLWKDEMRFTVKPLFEGWDGQWMIQMCVCKCRCVCVCVCAGVGVCESAYAAMTGHATPSDVNNIISLHLARWNVSCLDRPSTLPIMAPFIQIRERSQSTTMGLWNIHCFLNAMKRTKTFIIVLI